MQSITSKTAKIYWQAAMRYKWAVCLLVFGMVIVTILGLVQPYLYRNVINTGVNALMSNSEGVKAASERMLYYLCFAALAGFLIQCVWRGMGYTNNFFQPSTMTNLLNKCYSYIIAHSFNFFSNEFGGSIVARVRRFERSFERIADETTWSLMKTTMKVSAMLIYITWHWPLIGLFGWMWFAFYVAVVLKFLQYKLPYDKECAKQDTAVTAHLSDTIANYSMVRLCNRIEDEKNKFFGLTRNMKEKRMKSWNLDTTFQIFQSLAISALEIISMIVALSYWVEGSFTIGDFAFLQVFIIDTLRNMWDVSRNLKTIYEAFADAGEMTEMLDTSHEVIDKPAAKELLVHSGAIEFRSVGFKYHEKHSVLTDFNLTIPKGKKFALVGFSGAGKSTIFKLLLRLMDVTSGAIYIDSQNIANVTQSSLCRQIACVMQDSPMRHLTVAENIAYARPDATMGQIVEAARAAYCHDFIVNELPDGYDTLVGERGIKLSGGQRQRIAIARAILQDAPILILDEATSSLDSEAEDLIQKALRKLMEDKTTIVIAHRLSTVQDSDEIIVIEKNMGVTQRGSHAELIQQGGLYKKLWTRQAGGFATSAVV